MSQERHLEAFRRGAVDLIDESTLAERLARAAAAGHGLRVKYGMDPSSPDLHVGHAVQLLKLRDLQELGHTIVLIVGDATALVGDPSGRNKLRPQLTRAEVEANLATYVEQAGLVLDMEKAELRHNSEWFDRMSFEDVLRLAGRMTVAQMIQRDTFQKRMAEEEPIGIHELLYPLMQGWDSVMVEADVELGGTDQLFNLLVGRDLQAGAGQDAQIVLTHPLLNGTDGRKMSKSYGNAIGLTDGPDDVFGKTMRVSDDELPTWLEQLTRLPARELEEVRAGHPRAAKARLAGELVALLHGAEAAAEASRNFDRMFVERSGPAEVPERVVDPWPADGIPLAVLLRQVGLAASSSEARRLVGQGGVRMDGEVVRDPMLVIPPPDAGIRFQVGKRRFVRVSGAGRPAGS